MNDPSITNLTPQQLRRAAAIKEKIQSLEKALRKLLLVKPVALAVPKPVKSKRKMSAAAKLSKTAKARWVKAKAAGKSRW